MQSNRVTRRYQNRELVVFYSSDAFPESFLMGFVIRIVGDWFVQEPHLDDGGEGEQ